MIGKKIQDALNEQINAELYSSYLYLAMAAYFESEGLPGFWVVTNPQEKGSRGDSRPYGGAYGPEPHADPC